MTKRASLAAGLSVLCFAATAQGQNLQRKPYLQTLTPASVVVVWTTDVSSESLVRYGSTPTSLDKSATASSGTQHEVKVTGLSPNTRYYYSVGTSGKTLAGGDADHFFVTAPTAGTKKKFRAWIVGDSGTGNSNQMDVRNAMLQRTGPHYRPHIYLHMGDMAYSDGTTSEFTTRFFAPYETLLRNTVTWPTLGNHEGHSSDSQTQTGPYYTAYVIPKAGEAGGLPSGTEAYYSFDYANVHFIVLDSHHSPRTPTGAMLTWMKNDLAATKQDWVIAYWHHPPYTKGSHNSDTEGRLIDMRQYALPILEAGGVDLVLAGHSHIYERSFLVDGAYATPTTAAGKIKDNGDGKPDGSGPYKKLVGLNSHDGAVYVVAGHGGAGISGTADHPLMYFSEKIHGSCLMDVQDNRLSLINVRKDGQISDKFTITKGEAIVIAAPDGAESLAAGSSFEIRWATVGTVPNVKLEYSTNDGGTWQEIAASVPNTGKYPWTVPAVDTQQGLVRVSSVTKPALNDESNAGFAIMASVPQTAIPFGSTWKYHDQGVDLGSGWNQSSFDDGSWAQGPAQLGYGDGDEATTLLDANPNHPSAYFRKTISLSGPVVDASLKVLHDDGVAVWVNGTQVFAKYMDGGTNFSAWASAASQDNEVSTTALALAPNPFVSGDNVIAAMVKQVNATSSDLSFDLELTLTTQSQPPPDGGAGTGGTASGGGAGATGVGGDVASGTGGAAAGSGTGAGTGTGAGSGAEASGEDDGGCGCRLSPTSGSSLALLGAALGLALLRRRRAGR
jgi:MYXO-CTERM domain-containing protein